MRNIKKTITIVALLAIAVHSQAQEKKKDTVTPAIKKTAKKVGNKTAELAVKGTSAVADQTYRDKVGPNGQTIYIDGSSRYYYVDGKGKKVYLKAAQLKNKPKN